MLLGASDQNPLGWLEAVAFRSEWPFIIVNLFYLFITFIPLSSGEQLYRRFISGVRTFFCFISCYPFLLAFEVGGLRFELCLFVTGWRHALRSEWPFNNIISIISGLISDHLPDGHLPCAGRICFIIVN